MKKKKILILFLAIISLSVFAYCVTSTYAKYRSSSLGNMATDIYQWHFKINDEDIESGSTDTYTIAVNFKEGLNDSHKLYPGTEGYFQIVLDYSAVNLDFTYNVSIDDNSIISDLGISSIKFIDEDGNEYDDPSGTVSGNTVSGTILKTDTPRTKTIKAFVKWNDDDDNDMDDSEDTDIAYDYGNTNTPITFNVHINLVQKNS